MYQLVLPLLHHSGTLPPPPRPPAQLDHQPIRAMLVHWIFSLTQRSCWCYTPPFSRHRRTPVCRDTGGERASGGLGTRRIAGLLSFWFFEHASRGWCAHNERDGAEKKVKKKKKKQKKRAVMKKKTKKKDQRKSSIVEQVYSREVEATAGKTQIQYLQLQRIPAVTFFSLSSSLLPPKTVVKSDHLLPNTACVE